MRPSLIQLSRQASSIMAPIPVALCGKNPNMASSFVQTMGPDYEVVHVWHDTSTARQELPALLRGESVRPRTGLGTNMQSETARAPKAVVVGAGFARSDVDIMRDCEGGDNIPWLYPQIVPGLLSSMSPKDFMQSVVDRASAAMEKNGLVEGKEVEVKKGEVWGF
ncbi:hypothetical protein K431DRAFT_344790 [Polychaeton citri CBS 116435]|uniref:Uncharacterized protein n=1 Tax=Polychaeton citri CBS 116435 TaxID=1314669 RepID=A0A9P4QE78_9PEZI|nr:hypothetical protein K431DRAFT_344790 [Polychaeton citri CBS 116435]